MTAERDSMTLQEMGAPALGVEERRDEAPGAGASHARPTPDPEVVAKPKRRKFTAQYRLRILEEAESCTQPGAVGRLLRREGLYSSHLTEWRRARREGSLQGLTPSKRGRKLAERNPLSAKVHELEAKVERHGPALVGVPAAVCLATSVTCAARAIDGNMDFDFLGVRAQGGTATGGLWLAVFLAVALSVRWLW